MRHRRGESCRVTDGPISQQTAAAPARDAEFLLVDVTTFEQFVDAGHQIFEVVAGIVILNDVAEILTVRRAAARIRIQNDVTLRRHPLKFMNENVAVGNVRAAVNV